jgi:hypothetical protein
MLHARHCFHTGIISVNKTKIPVLMKFIMKEENKRFSLNNLEVNNVNTSICIVNYKYGIMVDVGDKHVWFCYV